MHQISIRSLNVCFECPETFHRRFSKVIQEIELHLPSVVCFQECVPPLVSMLSPLREFYDISTQATNSPYCTLMLCRKELSAKFFRARLPSRMGRDLLFATIENHPDFGPFVVGTTHLESLDFHSQREIQLREIHQVLSGFENVALLGDFNFCSERNFNQKQRLPLQNDSLKSCLPDFVDVWPFVHGETTDKGFTFIDARNQWRFPTEMNPAYSSSFRFDRALVKLSRAVQVVGMELCFHESIGKVSNHELYMSDHLGMNLILGFSSRKDDHQSGKRVKVSD